MTYRFGVFEFVPATGELHRDGVRVRLEPQPAKALACLLERAGALVSRDELRERVWGGDTHVDFDRGLAYCVSQVRAALGDSGDNPRFVQTLPRRGFRFIAPVTTVPGTAGGTGTIAVEPAAPVTGTAPDVARPVRRWAWPVVAALALVAVVAGSLWIRAEVTRPIVAVAVFDNETGDPALDRIASAASDVVVERLTALGPDRIGIIGNARTLRLPRDQRDPAAIRRETGAGYFIFGQLQPADAGHYRLVTHLIRLDDDTHLWVTGVTREREALAAGSELLADRTADAVRWHLIDRRPDAPRFTPESPAAVP
ncbi:MAG: winged helix-turn-helix domain-containing protein [Vicinamibacterales bacterium]